MAIAETDFSLAKYSKTQQVTDKLFLGQLLMPEDDHDEEYPLDSQDHIEVVVKSTVIENELDNSYRNSMRRSGTVKNAQVMNMEMGNFPYIPESPRVSEMLIKRSTNVLIEDSSQSLVL